MDIEKTPRAYDKEFDVALCFEVLEHLNNVDKAISYLANHCLKEDGLLIASTPNRMVF